MARGSRFRRATLVGGANQEREEMREREGRSRGGAGHEARVGGVWLGGGDYSGRGCRGGAKAKAERVELLSSRSTEKSTCWGPKG